MRIPSPQGFPFQCTPLLYCTWWAMIHRNRCPVEFIINNLIIISGSTATRRRRSSSLRAASERLHRRRRHRLVRTSSEWRVCAFSASSWTTALRPPTTLRHCCRRAAAWCTRCACCARCARTACQTHRYRMYSMLSSSRASSTRRLRGRALCSAADRTRLDSLLRRSKRLGYCRIDQLAVADMFSSADDEFFSRVKSNSHHVLQPYLPDDKEIPYQLRARSHTMALINKTKFLNDADFIIRLLYKHSYWSGHCYIISSSYDIFDISACYTKFSVWLRLSTYDRRIWWWWCSESLP